ncbi:hypothetical protein JCM10212_001315 [Sporobolomyces blumeae]
MADYWLKADYPIGPFAKQPIEQAVADVLAKAPWAAWQTGEVAFRYELIDRPEAGTALLALLNPPHRPPPPDGLRYLVPDSAERRSVTRHTVACPANVAAPTQNQPLQVELECFTSYQGHLAPVSLEHPLEAGSPELRLTRFRKRWRIANGQYPGLWFFWWGRDEHGGAGTGGAPTAPPGWERSPVRQYPLVKDPGVPTQAMYPFPGPGRLPPNAQPQLSASQTSMPPPGTPQTRGSIPNQSYTPLQVVQQGGLTRQEQLAALTASQAAISSSSATLEARQAQYYAQQQQLQQAQQQAQVRALAATAAAAASGGGGGAVPASGYGMTPAQLQAQHAAAQQQAQRIAQQQQQQQQQAALAAAANGRSAATQAQAQRKPTGSAPQPVSTATAAAATAQSFASSGLESETPSVDVLDVLTARQLAIHRIAAAQEALAPVFDPWSVSSILAGQTRKRQVEDAIRAGASDPRTGESKGGVAGFGREHSLTILGTSAARVAAHASSGRDPEKVTLPLDERTTKLNQMLEHIRRETAAMERRHAERIAQVKALPAE